MTRAQEAIGNFVEWLLCLFPVVAIAFMFATGQCAQYSPKHVRPPIPAYNSSAARNASAAIKQKAIRRARPVRYRFCGVAHETTPIRNHNATVSGICRID